MINIVAGEEPGHVQDGFLAAFRMHTEALQLFRTQRFQPGDVCFANRPKKRESELGISFQVIGILHPFILIVRFDGFPRIIQCPANPVCQYDFPFREMRKNLRSGPFVCRRFGPSLFAQTPGKRFQTRGG